MDGRCSRCLASFNSVQDVGHSFDRMCHCTAVLHREQIFRQPAEKLQGCSLGLAACDSGLWHIVCVAVFAYPGLQNGGSVLGQLLEPGYSIVHSIITVPGHSLDTMLHS